MAKLDLADLSLFRHVAEAGSITGGAVRAHTALAAASTRVRGMETILGTCLLERSRQGVTLTPAGHALLAHARNLLAQADLMHEELGAFSGGASSQIRLLSNTNALTEFLPEVLGRFLADYPGIAVDLQERLSDEIVVRVAEGAADLGIVAGTVDTGALLTLPFRSDRFVIVAPVSDPIAGAESASFAEVLDRDFIGLDRESALQRFLADRALREGRRLHLRVQLRSFDAICLMVQAGVGIGIVPETTARRAQHSMSISAIPLRNDWAQRDLRVCLRRREASNAALWRLVGYLCPGSDLAGRGGL
ncbi:LysR substrate-binding domain-containing protein [Pseudomonas sp. S 311-6]|uniref:DNA-binding transcriptional LysR family regulator n=1 Tax=Kerstersia gyiorum TaxID=206506 RepID=A0A171KU45_9BURK|nr:LysR substrate-binding domain-containing protein [Kerstersia gyiorum]MCO7643212.1 LysR substrate-binding domain-containing protein [Pseudomonas sp. S 311-6]KAB0543431.1 LysR family transcriptional regulator [Kerstersia gyiorum]KKO72412.1 LysR family transcriptional regulator [Kerstersia gyiorum]MCH4272017.1 LysR substrate-binding domain-containing protein [Kerstersia gyiorum]MCI1228530.1 LysR substrate-binding domain-containing protein [Kerstersia gyiorum]